MSNSNLSKNKPTTLVIHGANVLGEKLIELLSIQKSNVLLIDDFNKKNRKFTQRLKSQFDISSYDVSSIPTLTKQLNRVDYVFILLDQQLEGTKDISSKAFLTETSTIDNALKLAHKKKARVLLTSSISVHQDLANLQFTSELDKLSDQSFQNAYSSQELQRYCENLVAEYHDKANLDVRITRLGELMGAGVTTEKESTFVNMVKDAVSKTRITIRGEGLEHSYYVHLLDAVYGMIKAMFSNNTSGEVFSLTYPEEISVLNLAYRILELNPNAEEISFAESQDDTKAFHPYVPAKNLSKIGWFPKITFEQALVETLDYFYKNFNKNWRARPIEGKKLRQQVKNEREYSIEQSTSTGVFLSKITKPIKNIITKIRSISGLDRNEKISIASIAKSFLLLIIITIFYAMVLIPGIQFCAGGYLTYQNAQAAYENAKDLEIQKTLDHLEKSNKYSELTSRGLKGLSWINKIGLSNFYNSTTDLVNAINHLSNGGYYLAKGFDPYIKYFKEFEPISSLEDGTGSARGYHELLTEMESNTSYLSMANIEITLATESLNEINIESYPEWLSSRIKLIKDLGSYSSENLYTIEQFAYFIPELLGKDGRQTYIVLFQNPMELRSTGGWLTSYAIVGIENGQIRQLTVDDSYNVDGQLSTNFEAPTLMTDKLDIENMQFSLSNWDPNFPTSAELSENLLKNAEFINSADGVIAVDLTFVSNLIDVWGEINIPGESEAITKDNMANKIIEIHRAFEPGSREKPDFIAKLSDEIMKKLFSASKDNWGTIAQIFSSSLEEKHILIHSYDSQVSNFLETNGWSGSIPGDKNLAYPVEWNYGGNKANFFLDRNYRATLDLRNSDIIKQSLEINYTNSSTQNTYPEGDYKNFIRIYIPESATEITTENIQDSEIIKDSNSGLTILTGFIEVETNSSKSVSINYNLPGIESQESPVSINAQGDVEFEYNLIKQPGLEADSVTIEVNYPSEWNLINPTNTSNNLGTIVERTDLQKDLRLSYSWQR